MLKNFCHILGNLYGQNQQKQIQNILYGYFSEQTVTNAFKYTKKARETADMKLDPACISKIYLKIDEFKFTVTFNSRLKFKERNWIFSVCAIPRCDSVNTSPILINSLHH